ncbi:MAG: hypothetical protein ACFFCQ_14235, partial [Promethearchaeota archaeon]
MKVYKQILTRGKDGKSIQIQLLQKKNQRIILLNALGTDFSVKYTEKAFLEEFFPCLRELVLTTRLIGLLDGIANWDWTFWYDELVQRAKKLGIPENDVKQWLNSSDDFYITKYGLCMPFSSKKAQIQTPPVL